MRKISLLRLSKLHWFVIIVAILLSTVTIYTTNRIVNSIKENEKEAIELYTNNLEFLQNADSNQNLVIHIQILESNTTIPTILVDTKGEILRTKNVDIPKSVPKVDEKAYLQSLIEKMELAHDPLVIMLRDNQSAIYDYQYVYYGESKLLTQLQYYPYLQLGAIFMIIAVLMIIIRLSTDSESNKLWVGLAKETAHQLGTPISSLMAWIEYMKADNETEVSENILFELSKDVDRLTRITDRFSNIGSIPKLKEEDVYQTILNTVNYLQPRIPKDTHIQIHHNQTDDLTTNLNKSLFEWVIENICRNAVDAMSGKGTITIMVSKNNLGKIIVDIEDQGKGIKPSDHKRIFKAGYSTRKRGWGLGLTLVKRIIKDYHKGHIFIKQSQLNVGTTFRIELFS